MKKISEKKILPFVLLGFFLGGFGAHRFYVGKNGSAVAILLLSLSIIGLIPALVWCWVDIIIGLTGNFKDSEDRVLEQWT